MMALMSLVEVAANTKIEQKIVQKNICTLKLKILAKLKLSCSSCLWFNTFNASYLISINKNININIDIHINMNININAHSYKHKCEH